MVSFKLPETEPNSGLQGFSSGGFLRQAASGSRIQVPFEPFAKLVQLAKKLRSSERLATLAVCARFFWGGDLDPPKRLRRSFRFPVKI